MKKAEFLKDLFAYLPSLNDYDRKRITEMAERFFPDPPVLQKIVIIDRPPKQERAIIPRKERARRGVISSADATLIREVVHGYFGVKMSNKIDRNPGTKRTTPHYVSIYFMRRTGLTTREIGGIINRDHSTVSYADGRIKAGLRDGCEITRLFVRECALRITQARPELAPVLQVQLNILSPQP